MCKLKQTYEKINSSSCIGQIFNKQNPKQSPCLKQMRSAKVELPYILRTDDDEVIVVTDNSIRKCIIETASETSVIKASTPCIKFTTAKMRDF